jgi:predicted RNA-binding protein (virulence factor B family)
VPGWSLGGEAKQAVGKTGYLPSMRIGAWQTLTVERETPQGVYLGDGQADVLLPRGQVAPNLRVGDDLDVFVYTDSEDRPVATIKKPLAIVGEFAMLRVVSITAAGAFLDWGLDKDLFCPRNEQLHLMRDREEWVVRVYLDEASQRVACTTRLNRYLRKDGADLELGQKVRILISDQSHEAATVIIDGHTRGLLFPDEWVERLRVGEERDAYVKQIRELDGRVAVSLRPQGFRAISQERHRILEALGDNGGTLPVSDKSSPEEIYQRFGMSKGAFKKLIGALYREGDIEIFPDLIRLKEHR